MSFLSSKESNKNVSLLPMSLNPVFRSVSAEAAPSFQSGLTNLKAFGSFKQDLVRSHSSPNTDYSEHSGISRKDIFFVNVNTDVPVWSGPLNWRNTFKTQVEASQMLALINNYCQKRKILDIHINNQQFEITGRYFSEKHELAEFMIRVYKLIDSDSKPSTLVQISRLHGSSQAFQSFYINLINAMNEIITYPIVKTTTSNYLPMPSFDMNDLPLEEDTLQTETTKSNQLEFLVEIIEMIENGFHQETRTAAAILAQRSLQPDIIQTLDKIPDVSQRLISICSQSVDVLIVRCILVILLNGLFKLCTKNISTELRQIRDRWSSTQKLFNCQVEIPQSYEITTKIDELLTVLA